MVCSGAEAILRGQAAMGWELIRRAFAKAPELTDWFVMELVWFSLPVPRELFMRGAVDGRAMCLLFFAEEVRKSDVRRAQAVLRRAVRTWLPWRNARRLLTQIGDPRVILHIARARIRYEPAAAAFIADVPAEWGVDRLTRCCYRIMALMAE
jgi:hypothetical protein